MPTLSIVIPAFNEQPRLPRTLQHILDAWVSKKMKDIELHQVIIADDGSHDRTSDVAQSFSNDLPIHVVRLPVNKGKGAACRAGVEKATGELVLLYDADAATPIEEVAHLYAAMQRDRTNVAIGSRVKGQGALVTMSLHRRIIGRIYHGICSRLVPGVRDTACGCKLFTQDLAKKLFQAQKIDRFAFDVEILALCSTWGEQMSEVPVRWTAVPESKVRVVRDGFEMFKCVVRLYLEKKKMRHTVRSV